jgi:hypothetical protein
MEQISGSSLSKPRNDRSIAKASQDIYHYENSFAIPGRSNTFGFSVVTMSPTVICDA